MGAGPVWVTGGRGFVGRHLMAALAAQGRLAIATSRQAGPGLLALPLNDLDACRAALRAHPPSAVVHLAGFASVGRSFAEPAACWQANVQDAVPFFQALAEWGEPLRVVVASSGEVYGPDRSLSPDSPYGASKLALEALALQVGRSSALSVVVARCFNQVGPGQAAHFALPSWARQIAQAERGLGPSQLSVGNLEARRDLLDVRDAADGLVCLLDRGPSGACVDLGSGVSRRMGDALEALLVQAKVGLTVAVSPERLRTQDAPERRADPSAAMALGWRPRRSLAESLGEVLAEARAALPWVGDACGGGFA